MANKTLDYYLNLPYTIELSYTEGEGWFARVRELTGCMAQGDAAEETASLIQEAMELWLEDALEDGLSIPEPRPVEDYSGKFVVRVSRSLHRDLAERANDEGISLNQYINTVLAKAVGRSQPAAPTPAPIHPPWPGLQDNVRAVLLAAGLDEDTGKLDEQLFAQWVENGLQQIKCAIQKGYFQDARRYLEALDHALHHRYIQASPVLQVFKQTVALLDQQIDTLANLQRGILNDMAMRSRIDVFVQRSNQAMTQQVIREERVAYSQSSTSMAAPGPQRNRLSDLHTNSDW